MSTFWTKAMLVNWPANTGIEACDPENIAAAGPGTPNACWRNADLSNGPIRVPDGMGGFIENYALYQEDPSNVHHAYTGDFIKVQVGSQTMRTSTSPTMRCATHGLTPRHVRSP